jgi:hypothetical protein
MSRNFRSIREHLSDRDLTNRKPYRTAAQKRRHAACGRRPVGILGAGFPALGRFSLTVLTFAG